MHCCLFKSPEATETEFIRVNRQVTESSGSYSYRIAGDPLYLEAADFPVDATLEILNLSEFPDGSFERHGHTLVPKGYAENLKPQTMTAADEAAMQQAAQYNSFNTGFEDLETRNQAWKAAYGFADAPRHQHQNVAGFYVAEKPLGGMRLSANAKILIRTVDAQGRASQPVAVTVSGNPKDLPGAVVFDPIFDVYARTEYSTTSARRNHSTLRTGNTVTVNYTDTTERVATTTVKVKTWVAPTAVATLLNGYDTPPTG